MVLVDSCELLETLESKCWKCLLRDVRCSLLLPEEECSVAGMPFLKSKCCPRVDTGLGGH